jgi:hypothetical protein
MRIKHLRTLHPQEQRRPERPARRAENGPHPGVRPPVAEPSRANDPRLVEMIARRDAISREVRSEEDARLQQRRSESGLRKSMKV